MNGKNTIDLHIHSTGSDGTETPEKIVKKAALRGLQFISITDHDDVSSLKIGKKEAAKYGLDFINGVELSVQYSHPLYCDGKKSIELHLLGYGFNPDDETLLSVLEENKKHRQRRATEIVMKLNIILEQEQKPLITMEEFNRFRKSIEGAIGRPHLAQLLIDKNIVNNNDEAFDKYLKDCNVEKRSLSLEEGAQLIRNAGGVTCLAHPAGDPDLSLCKITDNKDDMENILYDMLPYIDGIECHYWSHSSAITRFFVEFAELNGLIITGGSDHHGTERDDMGCYYVPGYVKNYFLHYIDNNISTVYTPHSFYRVLIP